MQDSYDDIVSLCKDLVYDIEEEGDDFRNTREFILVDLTIYMTYMDLEEQERRVKEYYGQKYESRLKEEINHYNQLRYSLLHKLEEIKFFFHEGPENRKTVISSNDCISSIQYLKRGDWSGLFVHMRSSDVENLLPLDLLYLCKILRELDKTSGSTIRLEEIRVTIGSAHYYTSNSPRE